MALPKPKAAEFNVAAIPVPDKWVDWATFSKQIKAQAAAAGQTINANNLLAFYNKNVQPIKVKEQQAAIQAAKQKQQQAVEAVKQKAANDKALKAQAAEDAKKAQQAKLDADKAAAEAKAAAKQKADEAKVAAQKQKQLDQQEASRQKLEQLKTTLKPVTTSSVTNAIKGAGETIKSAVTSLTAGNTNPAAGTGTTGATTGATAGTVDTSTTAETPGDTWMTWKDYWAQEKAKGTKVGQALVYWQKNIAKLNPALPANKKKAAEEAAKKAAEDAAKKAGDTTTDETKKDETTTDTTTDETKKDETTTDTTTDETQKFLDAWLSGGAGGGGYGGGGGGSYEPYTLPADTGSTGSTATTAASAAESGFDMGAFLRGITPSYWNMNKARNDYWSNTFSSPATAATSGVTQSNNPLGWTGYFTTSNPYTG